MRASALGDRIVAADGFHSSRRRCVTSIRHAVRTIASRLTVASYGRKASVNSGLRELHGRPSAPRPRDAAAAAPRPACAARPGSTALAAGSSEDRDHHQRSTSQACAQHGPPEQQQQRQRRRHEAAPQVVEDLPPRQRRQRIAQPAPAGAGHARQQPARNLPVAADPAVPAAHVRAVASTDTPRTAARRSASPSARSSPRAGRG